MKNPLKALLLLGLVFGSASLALPWNPESSLASPQLANATPTPNSRPRAGSAGFTVYLPFIAKPPGPIYLPMVARPAPPTPTPTATPTATPIPANPVQNGGFETANSDKGPWFATWWPNGQVQGVPDLRTDRSTLATVGVSPHGGDYAAWLGNYLDAPLYLQQEITIPAGASTLTYWAWIQSNEPDCGIDAWAVNGAGVYLTNELESFPLCTATATNRWVKHTVDISDYRGQVDDWLSFVVRIQGANSSLFIDDVSIQ